MKGKSCIRRNMVFVLSAICLICMTLFIFLSSSPFGSKVAQAQVLGDDALSEIELKETYTKGDQLDVPSAKLTVNGKEYETEVFVYYPNGEVFMLDSLTLDQMGIYVLEYRAEVDNVVYKVEKEVKVFSPQMSMSDGSEVAIVQNDEVESQGALATLKDGVEFQYGTLDLSGSTADAPFLDVYILPSVIGECDFACMEYILTDIYDPENYVVLTCNANNAGAAGLTHYWTGNCATQLPTGVEDRGSTLPPIIHQDNGYGAFADTSFSGCNNQLTEQNLKFYGISRLFYDEAKKSFSVSNGLSFEDMKLQWFIVDLDNPEYFDSNNLWGGFTTGEVYLTIRASKFIKGSGQILVTGVDGAPVTENGTFYDTVAPELTVDLQDYTEETIPAGAVNLPYKLFSATAKDDYSGDVDVSVKVYRDYGTENQINVSVSDGQFVPKKAGTYTIVYTAVDDCMNETKKTFNVTIEGTADPIVTEVQEAGDIEGNVYDKISLAKVAASGGYGNKELTLKVYLGDAEINTSDNAFVPQQPGTYCASYKFQDYCGQVKDYEYEIKIDAEKKPVFTQEINLPKYLICDSFYDLPEISAYDFDLNEEAEVKITVSDAAGENRVVENNRTKFQVNNSGEEVKITYTATSANGSNPVTVSVPAYIVRDGRIVDLASYFVAQDMEKALTDQAITFSSSVNGANAEFIHPVLVPEFSLKFMLTGGTQWEISLTDSINTKAQIKLLVAMEEEQCVAYFGEKRMLLTGAFDGATEFVLSIDNAINTLKLNNVSYDLSAYKFFDQFTSKKAYLNISMKDGGGSEATFALTQINNQLFSNKIKGDMVRPQIVYIGDYGGLQEIDSVYVIKSVLMQDVLNPDLTAKVSVTDPKGEYVKDENGVLLKDVSAKFDYTIKLDSYGVYIVEYTADMNEGTDENFAFTLIVEDQIPPQITINGNRQLSGKVNKTVSLPQATVSDNLSQNLQVYMYLIDTQGIEKPLEKNSFVPDKAGTYTVRYLAVDEAGNLTVESVTVQVV